MSRRSPLLLSLIGSALGLGLGGCDNASGPSPLPTPTPPAFPVETLVFYDQNGNSLQDGNEALVVPLAEVAIAGRTARSAAGTGRATVANVPGGTVTAALNPLVLPPFYSPSAAAQIAVPLPAGEIVRLGAQLPIGPNEPAKYMAFGDSITEGAGSSDDTGYRELLEARLAAHFGDAEVIDQSIGGTRSNSGAERIARALRRVRPAYSLVLYGTNDWNADECRNVPDPPCFSVDSLRRIVQAIHGAQSLPVVGTIIPVNTGFDARTPESRNVWVADVNARLKPVVEADGGVVADLYAAFMAVPDFRTLFSDHVHPNDEGYRIIADTFFAAITLPPAPTGERSRRLAEPDPDGAPPPELSPARPSFSRGPFRR